MTVKINSRSNELKQKVSSQCKEEPNTGNLEIANVQNADICRNCTAKGLLFYTTDMYTARGKLLRAFMVVVATFFTIYVCLLCSDRYFYAWVQTVIERTDVHVSEIPFPAMTICPVGGINMERLQHAKEKFLIMNNSLPSDRDLRNLFETINEIRWASTMKPRTPTNLSSRVGETEVQELLQFISQECETLFQECSWRGTHFPCCDLFKKINTYKGICYAFNTLKVAHPEKSWPWRTARSNVNAGLRVFIKRYIVDTVLIMIHDPTEWLASEVINLESERILIAVKPVRFTADSNIESVRPELRHCYFTHEMKLLGKTRSECIRTCRMLYIQEKCNCSYHVPNIDDHGRPVEHNHTLHTCKVSDMPCLLRHRGALLSTGNFIEEIDGSNNVFNLRDCGCYPNCNYVQYGTSVYTDALSTLHNLNNYYDLQVYYQHDTFFSYRSVLVFTWLDLIVSYGGIAGLFLGLSLVGVIENIHQICICSQRLRKPKIDLSIKHASQCESSESGIAPKI